MYLALTIIPDSDYKISRSPSISKIDGFFMDWNNFKIGKILLYVILGILILPWLLAAVAYSFLLLYALVMLIVSA